VHLQSLSCPGGQIPVVGTACSAVSGAAGSAVSGAAGSILGAGVSGVFDAASGWVADGAKWLLDQVGQAMSQTTSVGLGTSWFSANESQMALLAAAVVLPMACIGAIQAIYRQSPTLLARSFLVNVPLSVLLTGVAVELVRLGLAVTDTMSQRVLAAGGVDTGHLLAPVSAFLVAGAVSGGGVPAFVTFLAAIIVAVCALVLWLELIVRAAAVAAAALFLPFALATLVWPAISHWCRRLAETIAALVLSKFVIAAVLSLAAGAIAGGLGTEGSNGGGFAAVATGIALLLIATLAPFSLLKLVPAVEAGAISHLEAVRHRVSGAARQAGQDAHFALSVATGAPSSVGTASIRRASARSPSAPSPDSEPPDRTGDSESETFGDPRSSAGSAVSWLGPKEGKGNHTGDAARAFSQETAPVGASGAGGSESSSHPGAGSSADPIGVQTAAWAPRVDDGEDHGSDRRGSRRDGSDRGEAPT
jgi:hypothetical protein